MVYQQKMWQSYFVTVIFLALSVYAFAYRLQMPVDQVVPAGERPSNFEECAQSGNPIQESFPPRCVYGDKVFTQGVLYSDGGEEIVPDGTINGRLEIGPFCPVVQEGVQCNVPTEAYTSRIAQLYDSTGVHVIEWRNIKDDGTFEFSPPPGIYFVDVSPGGMGPVPKQKIEVFSDSVSMVTIDVDTGIR